MAQRCGHELSCLRSARRGRRKLLRQLRLAPSGRLPRLQRAQPRRQPVLPRLRKGSRRRNCIYALASCSHFLSSLPGVQHSGSRFLLLLRSAVGRKNPLTHDTSGWGCCRTGRVLGSPAGCDCRYNRPHRHPLDSVGHTTRDFNHRIYRN